SPGRLLWRSMSRVLQATPISSDVPLPGGGGAAQNQRMWGDSWRQRVRLLPLYFSLLAGNTLGRLVHSTASTTRSARTGLSVVIPERASVRLLAAARTPRTFAIAAQIMQQSADGRREETGFTDWYADANGIHVYHAPPFSSSRTVPHLCASGGAALFATHPLRRYVL